MKYVYFVAYAFIRDDEGSFVFYGYNEVECKKKVVSISDLAGFERKFKEKYDLYEVSILNFQLLREVGEDGKSVEWDYVAVDRGIYEKSKSENERFDESVIGLYVNAHGLERCEFDDDCDSCDSPVAGMWAAMTYPAEQNPEALYYICGKCILDKAMKIVAQETEKSAGR